MDFLNVYTAFHSSLATQFKTELELQSEKEKNGSFQTKQFRIPKNAQNTKSYNIQINSIDDTNNIDNHNDNVDDDDDDEQQLESFEDYEKKYCQTKLTDYRRRKHWRIIYKKVLQKHEYKEHGNLGFGEHFLNSKKFQKDMKKHQISLKKFFKRKGGGKFDFDVSNHSESIVAYIDHLFVSNEMARYHCLMTLVAFHNKDLKLSRYHLMQLKYLQNAQKKLGKNPIIIRCKTTDANRDNKSQPLNNGQFLTIEYKPKEESFYY